MTDWPKDQDATFGNLPACGGFLISSQQKQGAISYVEITSQAGETCHLVNPWPQAQVNIAGPKTYVVSDSILNLPTTTGDALLLTPAP